MRRSRRVMSAICVCALLVSMFGSTGCDSKDPSSTDGQKDTRISTTMPTDTPTPTPSPSPTPTPDPATIIKNEALAQAEKIGMPPEALREKYELFLEYMDCVNNNPNLNEYRGYVAQLFPVIADHLKDENKEYFFGRLSRLICETQQLDLANAGIFYPDDLYVKVSDSEIAMGENRCCATIFHELMHFIDYNIEDGELDEAVLVKDHFVNYSDLTDDDWNDARHFLVSSFITEGGAELFTAKYFIKSTLTYTPLVNFLTGLEVIFGSEMVADMFYSNRSAVTFANLLKENGFENETIIRIFTYFNYITYPSRYPEPENPVFLEDVLIELYQKNKGDGWKEDPVFCHVLNTIYPSYYHAGQCENEEFLATLPIDYDYWEKWSNAILTQVDPSGYTDIWNMVPDGMFLDGKFYISARTNCFDTNESVYVQESLTCDYEFDTGKVKSFYFTDMPYPAKIPEPLPEGKELDDRLKAMEHDTSEMHKQPLRKGNVTELESLYAKATEIGNKYGVTVIIGDLVSEDYTWFQPEWYGDEECRTIEKALEKLDQTLALFPKGYFDQLNYGKWDSMVISLISSDVEMFTHKTDYDGKYHMGIYLHATEDGLKKLEDDLFKSIFYYTEMRLRAVSENMENPVFTDKDWKAYNPSEFYYRGDNTPEWIQSYYETYSDYVVSLESMDSAYSDRSCLMAYLMKAAGDPEVKPITSECIRKAQYYCDCIRSCFDTSSWPEKLPWEMALEDHMAKRAAEEEDAA